MKIRSALKKAKKKKKTVSSKEANMYLQNSKSFIHWLLKDPEMSTDHKVETLKKILNATDWEVDEWNESK
jgi:hypothetical protein